MMFLFEVARIQAIDNEYPLRIDINTSSEEIRIEGPAESVTSAVDEIHSIFREVGKEERSKLEAESVSKDVKFIICLVSAII